MLLHMYSPKGQSLIESLIAITIIIVGVVSLIGLLISSRTQSNLTENEALAVQLGSETLEAARFIRDSNWLEIEDGDTSVNFYDGLRSGTNYNGVYKWNRLNTDPNTAITFQFISGSSAINSNQAKIYQDANGFYRQVQTATPPGGWTETQFRRWVTIYPICYATGSTPFGDYDYILENDGETCADAGVPYVEVGVQVIAHVQWQAQGQTHDRYFEERLYNWKYAEPLD